VLRSRVGKTSGSKSRSAEERELADPIRGSSRRLMEVLQVPESECVVSIAATNDMAKRGLASRVAVIRLKK